MQKKESEKSCVLRIVTAFYAVICLLSILDWVEWGYEKKNAAGERKRRLPYFVVECWIFGILLFEALCLVFSFTDCADWWKDWFAYYVLLDVLRATMRDTVISLIEHPDDGDGKGEYIEIRNRPRWLILALLGAIQIILAFAILIKSNSTDFEVNKGHPPLDSVGAVYQSTLTFTTLGYGEITPTTPFGRFLVTAELIYFLLFLSVRLPVAVAVARVKIAKDSDTEQ